MVEILWTALISLIAYISVWFLLAIIKKDNSIIDIAWGLGFVFLAQVLIRFYPGASTPTYLLIASLISIWGIRLSLHIGIRKIGKNEDWRYKKYRTIWKHEFLLRVYLRIFLVQALLITVIGVPLILTVYNEVSGGHVSFGPLQFVGLFIWAIGFAFEVISDWQLSVFLKTRRKKEQIMTSGLWRYSRHPNYFGEVIQWWGIWLIVLGQSYGYLAIMSPLTITALIVLVSGIPLLEQKYKENPAYAQYARKTSIFFPRKPKKG